MLNSQPMGFYGPAQLVAEARRMGVVVRPIDVCCSEVECSLEADIDPPALRLGLNRVRGLSEEAALRVLSARQSRPFDSLGDLVHRAALDARDRDALARADALHALTGHRYHAQWAAAGAQRLPGMLAGCAVKESLPALSAPDEREDIHADYASTGLSLRRHPVALLRSRLDRLGVCTAKRVATLQEGCALRVAGLVINRQRPSTAKGTVFMTLEDEDASYNLIVWGDTFKRLRQAAMAEFVIVHGQLQRADGVTHVVVHHNEDHSEWLGSLRIASRDFH
jgi:error-prone DNA polymerase